MTYLSGTGILDDTTSIIQDNSSAIRVKMLIFCNVVAQKLALVRPWLWLSKSAVVTPVNNIITKPSDYGEFLYLMLGDQKILIPRNKLDAGEVFEADNTNIGIALPTGFTEDATTITLHGAGWTTTATLGYIVEPPPITDSATDTIWPVKCRSVFMKAILDWYYEYDMDERRSTSVQLSQVELSELKKWDNNQKPKTQYSRRGYHRTR